MKKLCELVKCKEEILIDKVVSDSREVTKDSLFVAIHGFNADRYDYLDEAISKGAVAVVGDRPIELAVPFVLVDDVNKEHLKILSRFYDHPEEKLSFIGVTGTDGKTTTATILWQLLSSFQKSAYIGTNGVCFEKIKIKTSNTTPTPEELYADFDLLVKNDCQVVAMELSSEGLMHGRADELKLDYAILTNISEDHLNIHETLENYIAAKKKIFSVLKETGAAILNRDDRYYLEVVKDCKNKVYTYGVNEDSDFQIANVKLTNKGAEFDILNQQQCYHFVSPFLGLYNIYNLTAALIPLLLAGHSYETIENLTRQLAVVPGRGEVLDFGQNFQIILDYAHTSNGIKNILETVKNSDHQRLITVTGSAGGREKEKRSQMGKLVLEASDLVIFTMDDPRHESVDEIIDDLIGNSSCNNYLRVNDRQKAIYQAFDLAEENDVVLIIGKGRDTYMAIGDKKLPYCDYDVIKSYFTSS